MLASSPFVLTPQAVKGHCVPFTQGLRQRNGRLHRAIAAANTSVPRRHILRGLGTAARHSPSGRRTVVQRASSRQREAAIAEGMCYLEDCKSAIQFPVTLPVLPFTPSAALTPGCTKVLHLYEDKDLELLEAVMSGTVHTGVSDSCDDATDAVPHVSGQPPPRGSLPGVFVHSSIEMGSAHTPCVACASSSPGALVQGDFVFFLSTLVQVIDIRCAEHGGLDVTIRGEGRVRLSRLKQLNPYITGEVWPVLDMLPREVLETAVATIATSNQQSGSLPALGTDSTDNTEVDDLQPAVIEQQPGEGVGGDEDGGRETGGAGLAPAIYSPGDGESDMGLQQEGGGGDERGLEGVESDMSESEGDLNEEMCNVDDEGEEGSCLHAAEAEALDFPEGREQPYDSVLGPDASLTGGAAGAGWVLRAMVQELRQVTLDVHSMLVRMGQHDAAGQITAALQWADDAHPLMCNLGTSAAAAHLYIHTTQATAAAPTTPAPTTNSPTEQLQTAQPQLQAQPQQEGHGVGVVDTSKGQEGATTGLGAGGDSSVGVTGVDAVLLPCAVSQLDRAVRLSFALLTLARGAGGEGWTGGAAAADPTRAALCTLDTRERLQIVITAAKSMRARLAAQGALRRLRHLT